MAGQDPKKDFESLSPVLELIYGLVKNMDSYLQVYAEDIKVDYLKEYKDVKAALQNLVQVLEQVFGLDMHTAKQVANVVASQVKQSIEETNQGQAKSTMTVEDVNVPPVPQTTTTGDVGTATQSTTTEPAAVASQAVQSNPSTTTPAELTATDPIQTQGQPDLPPLEENVNTQQAPASIQKTVANPQSMSTSSVPQTPTPTLEPTSQVGQQVPMGQPAGGSMSQAGQVASQPSQSGTTATTTAQPSPQTTPTSAQPAASQPQAAPTGNPDDDPELKAILDELKNIQGQQK